jgi:hypothetical protein
MLFVLLLGFNELLLPYVDELLFPKDDDIVEDI